MAEERAQRRLAAILAADVVGYSRLMGADEEGTLAALKSRRKEVLEPLVASHRGRVFKVAGDGVLVEFASAVNAVQCAIDLQQGMAVANGDLAADRRLILRIGVNLGDVMVEGSDLYGDGVNIASRMEALADPGSIYVSEAVYRHVRGKVALSFDSLGEQHLKNMAEPVRVYRVRPGDATPLAEPVLAVPDKPSIAVLPFQNMSHDPEQEYFADGIVEEIITALSRFQNLFVIARNSSFTYKGRAVDVKQVGRELGVRYVLEGSVRKAGDRLRITGQLIDTSNSANLWADRFDGNLAELFDLQDQVARNVVGAIVPRVQDAEIQRARRKPTENLDAYDHYLRALALVEQTSKEANGQALGLFKKAIERDPEFALAYARAAHCYVFRKANGWIVDRAREIGECERLARRAVELGRDDAIVLSFAAHALGYVVEDIDDGMAFVERALVLNPNLAAAWGASSWMKICIGEPDTGIEYAELAMRLSPLDPRLFAWQFYTAMAHLHAGRYSEAALWVEKALRDQPNHGAALRIAVATYALSGDILQAQKLMARLCQLNPQLCLSNLPDIMPPLRRPEDRARYFEGLRRAGLPK